MKRFARIVLSTVLMLGLALGWGSSAQAAISGMPVFAADIINTADEARLEAGGKIDLNNTNVRAFQQFPGMYPNLARKIVLGGPYSSVDDVLKLDLSERQKELFTQNKDNFTVLEPVDALVEGGDRINNGIYR